LKSPLITGDRFIEALELRQHDAVVVERLTGVWIDLQRTIVDGERFIEPLQVLERRAGIVERLGVAGLDCRGTTVTRKCVFETAQVPQRVASVEPEQCAIRFDRDRLIDQLKSLRRVSSLRFEYAEKVQDLGVSRVLCEQIAIKGRRFGEL